MATPIMISADCTTNRAPRLWAGSVSDCTVTVSRFHCEGTRQRTDRDSDGGKADTNTTDDSRHKHLPVIERGCLNGSADNDCDVGNDDGVLAADFLAPDESSYRPESTANVVDSGDEATHGGIGVAEHVLESLAGEDATEKSLIISILLLAHLV